MLKLDIPVVRSWSLRIPKIIRYMNAEFVEQFFESGKIMLTTYERCKNHEDSVRKDTKEGRCNFNLTHGNTGVSGIHTGGNQSYMLCASLVESTNLMKRFTADSYFVINDIIGFSDAISRYIPGFTHGKLGNCTYKDKREVTKETHKPIAPDSSALLNAVQTGNSADIEKEFYRMQQNLYNSIEAQLVDEAYFIKESEFAEESEFRIIWSTPYKTTKSLHIICPEAVKFCSPMTNEIKSPPDLSGDGHMSILLGSISPEV